MILRMAVIKIEMLVKERTKIKLKYPNGRLCQKTSTKIQEKNLNKDNKLE